MRQINEGDGRANAGQESVLFFAGDMDTRSKIIHHVVDYGTHEKIFSSLRHAQMVARRGYLEYVQKWTSIAREAGAVNQTPHRPRYGDTGMYGPPQNCKRKTNDGSWSAPMYSALSGVNDSGP
jgi:hypothetical protein